MAVTSVQSAGSASHPGESAHGAHGRKRPAELTEQQKREVEKLKARDAEVKAHEQAHVAAGGQYVRGGPNYKYQQGPDGKSYAVGGEVSIDSSPIKDNPQATITKMEVVQRAALAPGNPSGQDRAVAAQAAQAENQARQEESQQKSGQGAAAPSQTPHSLGSGTSHAQYTRQATIQISMTNGSFSLNLVA